MLSGDGELGLQTIEPTDKTACSQCIKLVSVYFAISLSVLPSGTTETRNIDVVDRSRINRKGGRLVDPSAGRNK